jgi:hypothetical protein
MQTAEKKQDHQPEAVSLFEVIASRPDGKAYPFGMTFTDPETASAYADRMNAIGYTAEVSPEFTTERNLKAALENARRHFEDTDIKPEK